MNELELTDREFLHFNSIYLYSSEQTQSSDIFFRVHLYVSAILLHSM
jgi:hypothetical protein